MSVLIYSGYISEVEYEVEYLPRKEEETDVSRKVEELLFAQKTINLPEKWILVRKIGKDKLTPKAQERLELIIFYPTIGKDQVIATATYFGVTRKTSIGTSRGLMSAI